MEHGKTLFGKKAGQSSAPSGVITTMFTDILSSTQLKVIVSGETSARRDAVFRTEIKEPHDAVVLSCVREAGGYVINSTGDGYCVTFVDAEEAILCAVHIQERLRAHPIPTPLGALQVRIGLHTGMVELARGDYTAATLDKTARVQSHADGGQVFISRETHALVAGKLQGIVFENAGTFEMKGLDAEGLYRVTRVSTPEPGSVTVDNHAHNGAYRPENRRASKQSKRSPLLWTIAAIGILLLGGLAYFLRTKLTLQSPAPALPVGSIWAGSFRFLPPINNYGGSAGLTITRRTGDEFEGTYVTEDKAYQWRVNGTVHGSQFHWEFTQALKNPGKEDAVGKAYVEGTVADGQLTALFHEYNNPGETATLQMRQSK